MERGLDPKLLFRFTLLISVPKVRSLFPYNNEGITYSLWVSAGLFVYYNIYLCVYSRILRSLLRTKRRIVEKEAIFHVKTILKVDRDMSGLWCSRKISQLKSVKGCAPKLIACFCPQHLGMESKLMSQQSSTELLLQAVTINNEKY